MASAFTVDESSNVLTVGDTSIDLTSLTTLDAQDEFLEVQILNPTPECTVLLGKDLLKPPPFENTEQIRDVQRRAFRFGETSNMTLLMDSNASQEEQLDYITGLIGTSIVLAGVLVVWSLILCLFRSTGYRRVGFLCGRFVRPNPPAAGNDEGKQDGDMNDDPQALAANETQDTAKEDIVDVDQDGPAPPSSSMSFRSNPNMVEQAQPEEPMIAVPAETNASTLEEDGLKEYDQFCAKQDKRIFRTRITLAVVCCLIIANCIIFCVQGEKYLRRTFNSVEDSFLYLLGLLDTTIAVIDAYAIRQTLFTETTVANFNDINGMCPNVRTEICEAIGEGCDWTGIPLGDILEPIATIVYGAQAYVFDEVSNFRKDLVEMRDSMDQFLQSSANLEWAFWLSFAFSLALGVNVVVILWGIHVAHRGQGGRLFRFYRRHVVFPIFIFFVLLSFVFSVLFVLANVGTSDWCVDSPDSKVGLIIDGLLSKDESNAVLNLAKYYVNGCSDELSPGTLPSQIEELLALLQDLGSVLNYASGPTFEGSWSDSCGTSSNLLIQFANLIGDGTCLLTQTLEDLQRIFWCRNWSPICKFS